MRLLERHDVPPRCGCSTGWQLPPFLLFPLYQVLHRTLFPCHVRDRILHLAIDYEACRIRLKGFLKHSAKCTE